MNAIGQFCADGIAAKVLEQLPDEYLDDSILSTLVDVSPLFHETFISCKLFGKYKNCSDWLFPTLTEDGLCYTFNSINQFEKFTNQ